MWGEKRGRCEGSPVGVFLARTRNRFQNLDFSRFSCSVQVLNFGSFRGFPQFLGDPKKSRNADFSAVSQNFEGRACPKILCGFSVMNRFWNLDFPWFPTNFRGPKNSQNVIFPRFLGILKDGLVQKNLELGLLRSFLGILKGRTHPKN